MTNYLNEYFFSLVIKGIALKRKVKTYRIEKELTKAGNENDSINECVRAKSSEHICKLYYSPNVSLKENGFLHKFLNEDSVENFILKSIFGFIGGVVLTYICFMFLIFSLNFSLKRATYICMGLGVVLTLGLAFSIKTRCTVFLCIPQLFSKRGRQALLAYAFILALSGPAKNTLHNVEVMSESLACTQEQVKQAENELLKCVHSPNLAAKKSVEKFLEKIRYAVQDFKNFVLLFYKTTLDILETVLLGQKWLCSISLLCRGSFGSPFKRCSEFLDDTSLNCKSVSDNRLWRRLCHVCTQTKERICPVINRPVCLKRDVPLKLPVRDVKNRLDTFRHRAINVISVKLEAHQIYSQCNHSSTCREEYQGVATEIRQKTDQFLQYFDFMSVIFGIFILVLFAKVIIYRHKFLTEDHFDNRFITSDFVDIDNTRAEFQMATVLPLEPREKMKYIKVTSIRLAPCERVRLFSSFVFLVFATFKIIIHLLTDSSLFWILSSIRRNERMLYMSSLEETKPDITIKVIGRGLVASLLRNITKTIKRQSATPQSDPTPCLPDAIPPDWNRYYQILALIVICWLLALCEPYGLRLRHSVMVIYHPDRARERAMWLYNRIVTNRVNFLKTARRQIRRKYGSVSKDNLGSFQFMRQKAVGKCLLCKVKINSNEDFRCPSVNCVGVFCKNCFASLKVCSICSDPEECGDLSDFSEEKDSSEDENACRCSKKPAVPKQKPVPITLGLLRLNVKFPKLNLKKPKEAKDCLKPKAKVDECRSTASKLRKKINVSDIESSDWECGVSIGADDNLLGDRVVDTAKALTRGIGKIKCQKEAEGFSLNNISNQAAVCLFRKLPQSCMKDKMERPKPNFLFRNRVQVTEAENNNSKHEAGDFKRVEASTNNKGTQIPTAESEQSTSTRFFPFIDPITILESVRSIQPQPKNREESPRRSAISTFPSLTPSRTRICSRSNDSSEFKICVREPIVTSSPESDCQYYNQVYTSSEYDSDFSGEKLSRVRSSPAILNLSTKCRVSYLVETDSSNEVFLAAKPIRKGRKQIRKKKRKEQEDRRTYQDLVDCGRRSNARRSDFVKAKLARCYRIRLTDRKSSCDCSSSVDTEYEMKSTVFLSDDEFQEISKNLQKKRLSQLSWAPDLLTDLPEDERSLECPK